MTHTPLMIKVCAIFMLLTLSLAHADDVVGPKAVVEETVTNIISVLEGRQDKSKLTEQNRQLIRHAVDGVCDYRRMSKYSLGKEWK